MPEPADWSAYLISAALNGDDADAIARLVRRVPVAALGGRVAAAWEALSKADDLSNPIGVIAAAGIAPEEILAWAELDRAGLLAAEAERQVIEAYRTGRQRALAADFAAKRIEFDALRAGFVETLRTTAPDALLARALAAEVDPRSPPPPDRPILSIAGRLASTTGNLTGITGRAKTAKSATLGAAAAATLVAAGLGNPDADTLGITSTNPEGRAVVWIDTEQSPGHAAESLRRALRRAGLNPAEKPSWLKLFPLAGWSAGELAAVLPDLIRTADRQCGGVHLVMLDGGADFALDVNSSEEAATLCAQWHGLAVRHACSVWVVVHSNEGAQSDDTARGWLGKQLRRKAESNLTLRRDDDVIVLFGENGQRHAPIPERDGPRYRWSDDAGMHLSIETAGSVRESRKVTELRELAFQVFGGAGDLLTYTEARQRLEQARACHATTAERKLAAMQKAGVIRFAGAGKYAIAA